MTKELLNYSRMVLIMIDIPDIINGVYETLGAPFIFLSIMKLYHDKKVRGVSITHALFFTSWGFWNLYYYPHLGQWASFIGGVLLVGFNTFWISQMIYYSKKEKLGTNSLIVKEKKWDQTLSQN